MYTLKTITRALLLIIFSVVPLVPILTPVANAEENTKYRLIVNATPSDSRIRIMNIKPKYRHGIALKSGKYDIEVTRSGYESKRGWVEIKNADLSIDVILNKLGAKETQNASQSKATKLLQQGWELRHAKKNEAALQSFQDAFISYRNIKNRKGEGIALMSLAAIYGDLKNNNKAIEYYQKALVVMGEISDHFNEGRVSLGLGMCYRDLKNYTKAIEYHQQSLTIARKISDQEGEVFALIQLGKDYYSQGDDVKDVDDSLANSIVILSSPSDSHDDVKNGEQTSKAAQQLLKGVQQYKEGQFKEAIETYLEILSINIVEGARDTEGQTRNLIGTSYRQLGQYQQALEYYQQALNLFQEIEDSTFESVVLTNIAVVYSYQYQYQQALKYYQRALVISKKEDFLKGRTLLNIGNVYHELGQYQEALSSYQKALVIGQKVDDRVIESNSLKNIGKIYHYMANQYRASDALQLLQVAIKQTDEGKHETALKKLQQALSIFKAVGNRSDKKMSEMGHFGEEAVIIWMGKIYEQIGQDQEALISYQQALAISKKMENKDSEETALSKLGEVYHRLGLHQKALKFYQQVLKNRRQQIDKRGEATTLLTIGKIYLQLNQEENALKYFKQVSIINQELNDQTLEGAILNHIATIFHREGKYQKALELLEKNLTLSKNMDDREKEGKTLNNIAAIYHELDQNKKALEFSQQALVLSREADDTALENRILDNIKRLQDIQSGESKLLLPGRGHELLLKGMQLLVEGEHQTALKTFQRSLAIFQEESYSSRIAINLFLICDAYNHLAQYQTALEFCQQALTISNILDDPIKGEKVDLLMLFIELDNKVLIEIGSIYISLDQYQKAIEILQKVSSMNQKEEYWIGENKTLSLMGLAYLRLSQYQPALESFQQALVIGKILGEQKQVDESRNLNGIGVIYREIGQYQKALDSFQQALIVSKKNDQREEGAILFNLGDVYSEQGKHEKALEHLEQALTISQENGDRQSEGAILNSIGIAYEKLKQYQKSLKSHLQSLAISREMDDRHTEGYVLNNIGLIYAQLGRYQEAQTFYQQALEIHENIGNNLWLQLRGLGLVKINLKQFDAGIIYLEQAIDGIEKLRTGLTEKEHKLSFIQDKLFMYDELIAILQVFHLLQPKKGYDRKAIEIFERKQGRVFLEEMGKSGARRFAGVPEEISQKDKELEQQIATIRKSRTEALAQGKNAEPHRKRLEKQQSEQAEFEKTLQTNYPAYYALKYPKPVALKTLQKNVLQADELMLIYNIRKEATDLWVVSKEHFASFTLPLTEAQMQQQVTQFRDVGIESMLNEIDTAKQRRLKDTALMRHLAGAVEENLPDFVETSYALYQQLLPEAVRQLVAKAKPSTLYIVPTGALYSLPFESLVTAPDEDEPHYLLQEYAIAYLSSASLLKTLRESQDRREITERAPLLAFADPVYSQKSCQALNQGDSIKGLRTRAYKKLLGGEGICFPPLPETADEVKAIAQLFHVNPYSQPKPLHLKESASVKTIELFNDEEELDDFQYVLFSTHAILPKEISYIEQPALVLSYPEKNGYLKMADVFGLKMNADLVMLSACNTGRGNIFKGEGVRGLTRAFMYAGTPAVAVTLWSVESLASKQLGIHFFTQLKNKQPLAKGLRQAKLAMLKNEKSHSRHPYFWAGFVVFGDGL